MLMLWLGMHTISSGLTWQAAPRRPGSDSEPMKVAASCAMEAATPLSSWPVLTSAAMLHRVHSEVNRSVSVVKA